MNQSQRRHFNRALNVLSVDGMLALTWTINRMRIQLSTPPPRQSHEFNHSTDQFACQLGIRPQTARKRYSQTGSYYGIRPLKLPNGKLRWPSKALEILSNQSRAATAPPTSVAITRNCPSGMPSPASGIAGA